MTALKAWQDPATAIPPDAPVGCQIYVIWGWDPWQRGKGEVCLWVGESARFWLLRVAEHAEKYWHKDITRVECVRDEVTGRAKVWPSKATVWEAEKALTHKLLPVHSWEHNRDNPWVVRNGHGVHRHLPEVPSHWRSPRPGQTVTVTASRPVQPMGWFGKVAWAVVGWAVIAATVWILAAVNAPPDQPISTQDGAGLGAVAASMVYGGIWWAWSKVRARKRTRKRK